MSMTVLVPRIPISLEGPSGHGAHTSFEAEKCAVLTADTRKIILLPSGLSFGFRADHSSSALRKRSESALGAGVEDEVEIPCCGGMACAAVENVGAGSRAILDLRVL